ncbi:MAG: hypothetical protein ACE5HT_11310 [Gemmatimonadales bacterium]
MIFLLDANFPPQLARALQVLDQEDCQFRHSPDEFGADAADEVIFAVFVFTGSALAQRSFREIAAFVLSVTDAILEKGRTTKTPFIWGITDRRRFRRLDG